MVVGNVTIIRRSDRSSYFRLCSIEGISSDVITENGYSKDPSLMPEGIAVTMGMEMIKEKGGLKTFLRWFDSILSTEDDHFMMRCRNKPVFDDINFIYVIVANRLYCRCFYGGYSKRIDKTGFTITPGGEIVPMGISWPHLILGGPMVKPNFKRELRGFQGFRYTTKLF